MRIIKCLPFLTAAVVLALIFAMFGGENEVFVNKEKTFVGEGDAPINQERRMEWEYARHRDPATGRIPRSAFQRSLEYAATLPGSYSRIMSKKERVQAYEWSRRGPINFGGRTRALALDVRDENIILAGGVSGGMWRSEDCGVTWTKTTRPDQLHSTSCLTQDTRAGKEDIWYCGTGEYFAIYGGLRGDGVYKSTDNGRSWFQLESTISESPQRWNPFDYVWNIVIDHTNSEQDIIYAATSIGSVQRSTDGGESWRRVMGGFGNEYSWFTDIAISPSGVLYATFSQKAFQGDSKTKGIYRSTDGIEWTEITPDFMPERYRRIVIGISPSDENIVYFLAETPESGLMTRNTRGDSLWHSLWKYNYISGAGSGEGGEWSDLSQSLPHPERVRSQFNSQGGYDLMIEVKPDNPDVVFIGGTNLYRSTDGFRTEENVKLIGGYCWDDTSCRDKYTYPNHHADQHWLVFSRLDPNVMYSGSDGGVAKTLNNMAPHVEWISLNEGYFTTQFYTCAIDHAVEGSEELIGGLQDNGTLYTNSENVNKYWTIAAGADGFYCAIADSAKAYYTSQNSSRQPMIKVWRAVLDEHGEREMRTRIDPIGGRDFIWNTPFKLDPNNNSIMYLAGGRTLWRNNCLDDIPVVESTDSISIGWDSLTHTSLDSLHSNAGRDERITAVEASENPANIVYYGTSYGRVFRLDSANIGNPKPKGITGDILPGLSNTACIAAHPNDADKVFAVYSNFNIPSVFFSSDGGENWTDVSGNIEENPNGTGAGPACYWLEILPIGEETMYFLGTSAGLYSTAYLDGKNTVWRQEGAETIGNVMVYMLDARPLDGLVVCGTYGLGVFDSYVDAIPPAPQAPVLAEPADGIEGILDRTTLKWNPVENAGLYSFELAEDPNFENLVFEFEGIKITEAEVYGLEQGMKKYYWRVYAHGAGGISVPSETGGFTTATSPPKAVFPENKSDSVELDVEFEWTDSEGADSYHFQLSENGLMTSFAIDAVVEGTSVEASGLKDDKRYYWRVSSIRNENEGLFSDRYNFKTKKIISVESDKKFERLIREEGIYPNPCSDRANIKFELNRASKVEVILMNARGEKIRTVIDARFAAGRAATSVNFSKLPSGLYYCVVKAGEESKIIPALVVK